MQMLLTHMHMQFTNPALWRDARWALLLIAAFSVLGAWLRLRARKRFGKEELISRFSSRFSIVAEVFKAATLCSIGAAIIFVALGPVQTNHAGTIPVGALQVVAVVDVSPSMAKEDYRDDMPPITTVDPLGNSTVTPPQEVLGAYGRNIDMVRLAMVDQIIPAIQGNQLGMVLYDADAKSQMELDDDLDKARLEFGYGWIDVGRAPAATNADAVGSNYVKGLQKALELFANTPEPKRDKVVLLFSDGGVDGDVKALDKDLDKVADTVNKLHIKVIIIGVGTEEKGPIKVYNDNGTFKENWKLENCSEKDGEGACLSALNMKNLTDLGAKFTGSKVINLKPGQKLPIDWSTTLAGTKLVHEQKHIYHIVLLPCVALFFLLEMRGLVRRRRKQ
jgi:hypothetical protein